MVVKKTNGDVKAKNGGSKSTRAKTNEATFVDKNGNMLVTESAAKQDEKCQVKRQGIKSVSLTDGKGSSNTQETITTYQAHDDTTYELDDCVYIDSQRPDVPFFICSIKEFKVCKRECVYVGVKWFYRPSEVPESVYQLLVQDRNTENGSRDHILEEPSVKERELFVSDAVDTYSVNALRGKCRVKCLSDVSSLKEFISQNDHFFFVLRYNPETRRLANHKGEIRVGPSHQVLLPECSPKSSAAGQLARHPPMEDLDNKKFVVPCGIRCSIEKDSEILLKAYRSNLDQLSYDVALFRSNVCPIFTPVYNYVIAVLIQMFGTIPTWKPTLDDYDLMMFVGAARSMAQYAGICKEGDTNKGLTAAARDATTINALKILHKSKYDTARALQCLVKRPFPKSSMMNWTEDDNKKFVKGLRQFGKNFYKIRKELLPEKATGDLVEYYYIWKKTPSALSSRPHRRRRHNVLRRRNITRSAKASSSEFVELSSCSEDDFDSEDSDKDFSLYCCRHCYSSKSRSWHHGGYERLILCSQCLEYFKKYGVMRKLEGTRDPPPYMFKGMLGKENEVDYFINGKQLRSRRSTPNTSSTLRYGRSKACSPMEAAVTRDSPLPERKITRLSKPGSPSAASTGSNTSSSGSNQNTESNKRRRTKRVADPVGEKTLPPKRQKPVTRESDDEPETDQSERNSSPIAEQEVATLEGEVNSESSRGSINEEACLSPSSESLNDPERECKLGKFAARNIADGTTSARTGLPFIAYRKAEVAAVVSKESGILKEQKLQNEEHAMRMQKIQKPEVKSIPETTTSSSMLSQQDEHRKYMARVTRYPYPGIPGTHGGIMGHMPVPLHSETPMFPWGLRPGALKDFESWYSPHKAASLNRGNSSLPPTVLHSSTVLDRNSPLHKDAGVLLPAGHIPGVAPPVGTDPVTGLHHSHSHYHTHYHVHPDNPPRSPSIGLEPNLLWRNPQHEMWLRQNPGHPHMSLQVGHPRHLLTPADDMAGVSPYFHGLYPPTRELQLQHELMLNQGIKIDHGYPFYPPFISREQLMRFALPPGSRIENELRRLDAAEESNASLLHRPDPRVMRSPVLKNFEYRSSNKIHETIDLSKDD